MEKHHVVSLRPARLFRSVGLSASLPPHRRLRSIPHNAPNTCTPAGLSDHMWTGRPSPRLLSDSGGPKNQQPHTNPFPEKHMGVNKASNLQTLQKRSKGLKEKDRKVDAGLVNPTAGTRGGDAVRHEDPEYFYEEVWRGERQKVKRNKRREADEVSHVSQRMRSLELTDVAHSHQSRSMGRVEFKPRGRGNRAGPLGKEEEPARRDRRPHFLPPITQSVGLLNVPLVLPENSPPPSPCSPSDVLFFPLSVPQIQPFLLRRETRDL